MHALWIEDQQLSLRRDISIPTPKRDEALIRVLLAGICSTDLELLRGYYPFTGIPGHEFVGEVVASPGDSSWIGKRIVGEINIACGACFMCMAGLNRHCQQRKTLGIHDWNGVLAEYAVLPLENLHEVPEQVPNEMAVFTEPLAAAHEILEQTDIRASDRVLLIGAGRLGQLVVAVLQRTGCQLDVVIRHEKQRQLLAGTMARAITERQLGVQKYDFVVEATGSAEGFALATQYVRPRGKIILKSTYKGEVEVNFSKLVVDEVTLIGSRCGSFEPAIQLLAQDEVDPRALIEGVLPLGQGLHAFEMAAEPGMLKVLIAPG